jgi:hypothetical protein
VNINAGVAQFAEHDPSRVGVAGSNPASRSFKFDFNLMISHSPLLYKSVPHAQLTNDSRENKSFVIF